MRVTFKAGLIFLLAVLVRSSESRTVDKVKVEIMLCCQNNHLFMFAVRALFRKEN